MGSRTQCRIAIAPSVLAALLPIALSVPAFAHPVPGFPSGNPGNSYYPASPARNAVGSAYSDSGAETPWQRRSRLYEKRRGGTSYGAGPNWLPGVAGVLGVLPTMRGGTSWPSWEQVLARSEGSPSTSGYQPYPGWATPPSQPNRPRSDAGPSGANWQPQPAPEPSGEAVVMPPAGSTGSSARPPSRTSHPPSRKAAGGGHPVAPSHQGVAAPLAAAHRPSPASRGSRCVANDFRAIRHPISGHRPSPPDQTSGRDTALDCCVALFEGDTS